MTTTPRIACEPTATVAETTQDGTEFKRAIRQSMRATRTALTAAHRTAHDAAIAANIEAWLMRHPVRELGVYWPIHGEPDLRVLYTRLAASGIRLALPKVVGRELPLQFLAWMPGDELVVGRDGIAVPAAGTTIADSATTTAVVTAVIPGALLIPCLAFNSENFRLGYGGGYYDRTLASMPGAVAIGVGYGCTQTEFPAAPHDIAMHVVITEKPEQHKKSEESEMRLSRPGQDDARSP
ncbi:MAG: 5-formyltetrahydrofolate cyclo-ligase [Pseudomonadota bacterium]